MKKLFVMAAVMCGTLIANAEDVFQIVPFQTPANFANEDFDTVFDLNLVNENGLCNVIKFDLYLPGGLDLQTDYDDADGGYAFEFPENSRTTYKKGPKTYSTGHVAAYTKKESDLPGFNLYTVLINQGTNTTPFQGTSGVVAQAYYKVGAMADGVYPIYVKNVEITDVVNLSKIDVASSTSYVVIGNPSAGELQMEGVVPSFVTSELATSNQLASLDLAKVTEWNGDFTYVDGRAVTAPTADVTVSAKYAKTVSKYASLTLPFDATFEAETAYKLTNVADGYAMFDAVTSAQAGDVVLLTKDVNLSGTKLGTVANATVPSAYYVSADGTELRQGTNVNVPALRGVWNINAGSNLRIMLDGVATDINMIDVEGEGVQAFDLQGRRTANAKNGVYVVNGKKQIVK